MDDIYENIEEYNTNKKHKILNIFDKIISDMLSNEKLNPIVTESFVRGKKIKHFFVFIIQSYFAASKNIRVNSLHCFIIKVRIKGELQ